ncbi:hypothetical protein AVEN_62141-1 [Araneus ventricosus]|uniref:Uncharacterized protein n=1 Tax=Araneus ventricosus TaxID=182803 RepID=A0A4Y2MKP3_ARAVE|nr:hypothetical protein AVEN_62141-1 [Araneus ventricosus]
MCAGEEGPLKLGTHEKARLCHLPQVWLFPPVAFRLLLLPHTADFRFCSLVARSQSRQNLCFPATLAARPSEGNPAIPIRLQTVRNSKHPIHSRQFSSVSQTDERFFSFPCSKNSRMKQR